MKMDTENLIKYIQNKLVKKVTFDIGMELKDKNIRLTNKEYIEIEKEAKKYEVSKNILNELIQESIDKISLGPKIEEEFKVLPKDLVLGQHIKLFTDDGNGVAIEELIFIGDNRFILINHERGSLLINDELKNLTSPWNIGGYVDFEVYRDDKKVIHENKYSIYRTRKLIKIQLLIPQFDYHSLDEDNKE